MDESEALDQLLEDMSMLGNSAEGIRASLHGIDKSLQRLVEILEHPQVTIEGVEE